MAKTRRLTASFYPWLVIALASLMLFYKYLLQVFPSVITDELMRDFQLSGSGLGNLAACFFYSYLIMQFFSGYLVDRFNMKVMIAGSVLISALGALLFATGDSFNLAMVGRALMGIGAAFATVGYMKTASIYFPPTQFALVSGLLTLGVMLGAVFGEAPLALLIRHTGWHYALVVVALAGVIISVLFFICVQNKPQVNYALLSQQHQIITRSDIFNILKNKTNWYLTLYSGLAFSPLAVFGGLWGTPFIVKAYQISQASASAYVSLVYVGFGVGGPLFGYLADRFRERFKFMSAGLILSLLSLLSIIYFAHTIQTLIVCTLLFGFSTGAFMLAYAVGKDINPIHIAATVIALINSGDCICGALSEPLIGKLLDINNHGLADIPTHFPIADYHLAFVTLLVELGLAYVFLKLIRQAVLTAERKNIHASAQLNSVENL